MKKVLFLFTVVLCLFATNTFAQEKVRGIETRLVKYDQYNGYNGKRDLYGIEFTNRNSISVSITMELWEKGEYSLSSKHEDDQIYMTKDIVLKPNESYIWRIEKDKGSDGELISKNCVSGCNSYYYKYEAYKLQ